VRVLRTDRLEIAKPSDREAREPLHPEDGGAWRKEEQTAALAAWVAWPS
jgi:hypothetical protein